MFKIKNFLDLKNINVKTIKNILLLSFLMLSVDSIYLYSVKDHFGKLIKSIQNTEMKINYIGAMLCYIFLVIGLYYFVIRENKNIIDAFILGVCIYAVFEYTNYAIFKKWSFITTIFDTIWGGILFTITTYLYYKLNKML